MHTKNTIKKHLKKWDKTSWLDTIYICLQDPSSCHSVVKTEEVFFNGECKKSKNLVKHTEIVE